MHILRYNFSKLSGHIWAGIQILVSLHVYYFLNLLLLLKD